MHNSRWRPAWTLVLVASVVLLFAQPAHAAATPGSSLAGTFMSAGDRATGDVLADRADTQRLQRAAERERIPKALADPSTRGHTASVCVATSLGGATMGAGRSSPRGVAARGPPSIG